MLRRKTCPTHRGLRLSTDSNRTNYSVSEDLPHSSGIKTECFNLWFTFRITSEDLPHSSGIKTPAGSNRPPPARRKTCPTHRGLRRRVRTTLSPTLLSRKTCPTHRGLRHSYCLFTVKQHQSEDLPHLSGIKTLSSNPLLGKGFVGRLAPLIGD